MLWQPYSRNDAATPPVNIVRAAGSFLYDDAGRAYLDATASWWTCLHGHGHSTLANAAAEQIQRLDHVMFAGFTHPPAQALADRLTHACGGGAVFFTDNGSCAVEAALKMALLKGAPKRRDTIIAFEHAYHGDTFGAMAVGAGSGFFHEFAASAPKVVLLPYPDTSEQAQTFARAVQGGDIAAVIVEPLIRAAGGMHFSTPESLHALAQTTQAAGVPLIFDEVAVGFGRTGSTFAFQQAGVRPDILCLAKGLSGGFLPLGATLVTPEFFEAFRGRLFAHGHSFTANPVACAVGAASWDLLQSAETQAAIAGITARNQALLHEHAHDSRMHHLRMCGTILAFEVPSLLAAGQGAYGSTHSLRLKQAFLDARLNLRPLGSTVYWWPPYSLTATEHAAGWHRMLQALETFDKGR